MKTITIGKNGARNKGMTLIEMMVVMGIVSVFSIFVVNLVITSQNAFLIQNSAVPMRSEAKKTMETIVKELREADPSAAGGIMIDNNSSRITFSVPNQVSQLGIQSWRQIQFSLNTNTQEAIRTESGVNTVIGRTVEQLTFANDGNNAITITVQTTRTTSSGTVMRSQLSSQTRLRN